MNKNINLTKILKHCPEGTEFWSDNYGKVRFMYIGESRDYPIFVKRTDGITASYTKEGWCSSDFPASCLLWPSKDCRDWSKFTAPWYKEEKFDPNTLKPFDKVLVRDEDNSTWKVDFFSNNRESEVFPFKCISNIYKHCIPYNDDTRHLVGTIKEAPKYYRYWED